MFKLIIAFGALFPAAAFAQNLQGMASTTLGFIDGTVIPFLLGIGFLLFMVNAIRYFVYGSGDDDGREKAKQLAIYSVVGFVIIVVFWGIVNLLTSSIGLDCQEQPVADYFDEDAADNFSTNPCPQNGSGGGNQTSQSGTTNTPQPPQNQPGTPNNIACQAPTTNGGTATILTTPSNCANIQSAGPVNLGQMDPDDPDTWLGGIIRTYPRPWRDYFWANWHRNGSNRNDPLVDCRLPNGSQERIPESECSDLGGVIISGTTTTNLGSFTLQNCTYTNPQTGQLVTVQVTTQDCQQLQQSGSPGTTNGSGSGGGSGGGSNQNVRSL